MPERRAWWPAAGGVLAAALVLSVVSLILLATVAFRGGERPPDAASADAGFARDMAVHHQQAVEMSFIVRDRTGDDATRTLAYDIINTQANQRGMLLGKLNDWGLPKTSAQPAMAWMGHRAEPGPDDGSLMPGMATRAEIERLREAGSEAAEVLYLRLMTDHHRSGVTMARGAADLVEDPVLARLAEGMADSQRSEIALMTDMLARRGAGTDG